MANIYEICGRLTEKYESELEAHRATIAMLLRAKLDPAVLARLTVQGDGWSLAPEPPAPTENAT